MPVYLELNPAKKRAVVEIWGSLLIFFSVAIFSNSIASSYFSPERLEGMQYFVGAGLALLVVSMAHRVLLILTAKYSFTMGILQLGRLDLLRMQKSSLNLAWTEIREIRIGNSALSFLPWKHPRFVYVSFGPVDKIPKIRIMDLIWPEEVDEKMQPFIDAKIPVRIF